MQSATYHLAEINGQQGIIALLAGAPYSVLTLDVTDDHIVGIAIVVNPEKLKGLVVSL